MGEQADKVRAQKGAGRFCRGCGYELRGLPDSTRRCPECGRGFDPADALTYLARPRRRWVGMVRRLVVGVLAVVLVAGGMWGWLFWGWYSERRALGALGLSPGDVEHVHYGVMMSGWPAGHHWAGGFVLERVRSVDLSGRLDVVDLGPVGRLKRLEELYLNDTGVKDLGPLAGLGEMRTLYVNDTEVADLQPLAGLGKLERLHVIGDPVRDLAVLNGVKSLRHLMVVQTKVSAEEVEKLRRELPACEIVR